MKKYNAVIIAIQVIVCAILVLLYNRHKIEADTAMVINIIVGTIAILGHLVEFNHPPLKEK